MMVNYILKKKPFYCGRPLHDEDFLRKYYSTHVVSGPECFSSIAGYHTFGISPAVEIINIHLPNEKLIYIDSKCSENEILNKVDDSMSKLERYFSRPKDHIFDNLTLCDYYSIYILSSKPVENGFVDEGRQKKYVVQRKEKIICGIHAIPPENIELFSLRLLLFSFAYRSFNDILLYNDQRLNTFYDSAVIRGLIKKENEFEIALAEAIKNNIPPSELRFLLALYCKRGANFDFLLEKFRKPLSADLENDNICLISNLIILFNHTNTMFPDTLKIHEQKIKTLTTNYTNTMFPDTLKIHEQEVNDEFILTTNYNQENSLNEQQQYIVDDIIYNIEHKINNLMFIQGRAGTGKTFLTNCLIEKLRNMHKKVLVTGTTGIAASQYPGGSTVHSLFSLRIDQKDNDSTFKCKIGIKSFKAKLLIDSDIIIIDKISMLTKQIANKVDFTLRYLMKDNISDENLKDILPFGGKNILFVGYILQLPPVIPNNSSSVFQKLITQCAWWNTVKTHGISIPMRSSNKTWNEFLFKLANNDVDDLKLEDIDGITVTHDFDIAEKFFLDSVDLSDKFPLDRQWICPTNYLVNEVNRYFHLKHKNNLSENQNFGIIHVITNVEREISASSICSNLTYLQLLDFARNWILPDTPDPSIDFLYGAPMSIMRNLNTYEGIVKNKRCWIVGRFDQCIVVEFEGGLTKTIPRINFDTVTN